MRRLLRFLWITGGGRGGGGSSRPAPTVKRGDVLKAKVVNVLGFGAFVMLPDGTQALLHVSEMRAPEGTVSPSSRDLVKAADAFPFANLPVSTFGKGAQFASGSQAVVPTSIRMLAG